MDTTVGAMTIDPCPLELVSMAVGATEPGIPGTAAAEIVGTAEDEGTAEDDGTAEDAAACKLEEEESSGVTRGMSGEPAETGAERERKGWME